MFRFIWLLYRIRVVLVSKVGKIFFMVILKLKVLNCSVLFCGESLNSVVIVLVWLSSV